MQCSCEQLLLHEECPMDNFIPYTLKHIWCGRQNGIFAFVTHVLKISSRCGTLNVQKKETSGPRYPTTCPNSINPTSKKIYEEDRSQKKTTAEAHQIAFT